MATATALLCRIVRVKGLQRTIPYEPAALFTQRSSRFTVHCYTSNYSTNDNNQKRTATSNVLAASLPKVQSLIHDAHRLMAPMSQKMLSNGRSIIQNRWDIFSDWYDRFSHTNEVREAHKHVEDLQEKLNEAQQLRRETSKELTDIRYKLQMCYADLANCQKGDPKYLEIIRKEFEVKQFVCRPFICRCS